MMDTAKKELSQILLLLAVILGGVVVFQWLLVNDLCSPSSYVLLRLEKILRKAMMIRFIYVLVITGLAFLYPSRNIKKDESLKGAYTALTLLLATVLVLGFSRAFAWYNLIIFPIVFILFTVVVVKTAGFYMKWHVLSDKSIFGLSLKKSKFFLEFETADGPIRIHRPQQNIYINGGPGSGKSESWIKGIIYQCAERNYAGFIYDWEGDPTKENSPILSRIAYGSIEYFKSKNVPTPAFAFINFVDMSRTVRVNVLSEKYVPKGSESLFIRNIATTLMKNLESSWKEKTDFWANNAINYVYSIAYKCYKEREKGIGTLAHVIAFALSDSDLVFRWLSEDITNREHPTLLCIGNAPSIKEAVSPPISCIASVIMSQMNNPGKQKSIFMVDEFPTINLQNIDVFIGTARKHYVATILALQDDNQAVRDYGKDSAKILKASCGTQAFGMTGNDTTAKEVESLFGEMKEAQESFSHQDSGNSSTTESLQKDKIVKARDVAGQSVGHFIGKIADGNPPFFNAQFNMCKFMEKEIPPFSLPVSFGAAEYRDKEIEIMEEIVQRQYYSVLTIVNRILEQVKNKYTQKKENTEAIPMES